MKKLYVDLSCDKISGQQKMQRSFKNFCHSIDALTTKEDADILVYVQVEPTQTVEEWKQLKQQGKKIVFIHHYLVKELTDIVAIFKIPGLLELVDLHIIMSTHGDILNELKKRGIDDGKIRIIEQAGVDRYPIEIRYFHRQRDMKTICYVGRAKKGLKNFVVLTKDLTDWHRSIFCPDIEKFDGDLRGYRIFKNLTGAQLFDVVSKHMFMYSPYVYRQPYMHLETVIHEAVHCGTAVIVDDEFENVVPDFKSKGFIGKDEFLSMQRNDYRRNVEKCSDFLEQNFRTSGEIQEENFKTIQSFFGGKQQ